MDGITQKLKRRAFKTLINEIKDSVDDPDILEKINNILK
jgi:hypothetical protein